MCNFTEGPWDWEHDNSTSSIIQVFSQSIEAEGSPDICRLQHEPDAHLIAAAPEMYEAIERVAELLEKHEEYTLEWLEMHTGSLTKLLSKARGEHV